MSQTRWCAPVNKSHGFRFCWLLALLHIADFWINKSSIIIISEGSLFSTLYLACCLDLPYNHNNRILLALQGSACFLSRFALQWKIKLHCGKSHFSRLILIAMTF